MSGPAKKPPIWAGCLIAVGFVAFALWALVAIADRLPAVVAGPAPKLLPDVAPSAMAAPVVAPVVAPVPAQAPTATPEELAKFYSVTKDDDIQGLNRKVEITLYHRVKQATLEAICRRIHATDAHQHETTFLFFDVLGEPKPPHMAHWAIARFEPDLFVQILGDE